MKNEYDNITNFSQQDIIAATIVEKLNKKTSNIPLKILQSKCTFPEFETAIPFITVWKCKESKKFPYYELLCPYVVIVVLPKRIDSMSNNGYGIGNLVRSIGYAYNGCVFEIMEYDCCNKEWNKIYGYGECFNTSYSNFLGVDLDRLISVQVKNNKRKKVAYESVINELKQFCKYCTKNDNISNYVVRLEYETIDYIIDSGLYHGGFSAEEFEECMSTILKKYPILKWGDMTDIELWNDCNISQKRMSDDIVKDFIQQYKNGFDLEKGEDWIFIKNFAQKSYRSKKVYAYQFDELVKFCKYYSNKVPQGYSYVARLEFETINNILQEKKYHKNFTEKEFEVELKNILKNFPILCFGNDMVEDSIWGWHYSSVSRWKMTDEVVESFMIKYHNGFNLEIKEDWSFIWEWQKI